MRKLNSIERNLLKPVFICLWPVVVPLNIMSDLIGSLTGNRNGINLNPMNSNIPHINKNISWFDQLGNEVFGYNDLNEDYIKKN